LIGSPAVARAAIIQVILLILLLLLDAAPGRLWSRSLIEHCRTPMEPAGRMQQQTLHILAGGH
jgi:hypothetical protein